MMWPLKNSYLQLPDTLYVRQTPVPVYAPSRVIYNHRLAKRFGLEEDAQKVLAVCAGNDVPEGGSPIALAYTGHQFGHFVPQLGDGRAVLLGELTDPTGKRWDMQLKGSGRTPFSRQGDGRAALGPMLREYLISEAMHALGIPTTRSLAVVCTGEPVFRETTLPGAVLTRIAASHLRVGTFEYVARQGDIASLKALTDYTIERHYPQCAKADCPALALLEAVMLSQSRLVAEWMRVGFIHGVMNTDNTALSGETIDYGPCAFMDTYDPQTVFSSIDRFGRYAYGNQPAIMQWNLARFAETLLPLIDDDVEQAASKAEEAVNRFPAMFAQDWLKSIGRKFGLSQATHEDEILMRDFLDLLKQCEADYTNGFRLLIEAFEHPPRLYQLLGENVSTSNWLDRWKKRCERESDPQNIMQTANPAYIPRNHQVESALDMATEHMDITLFEQLLSALRKPYASHSAHDWLAEPPSHEQRVHQTFCGT